MPDIWCDTRQQKGKHANIDGWFDRHGVTYEYRKLDFGDYIRADGTGNVSVDTKKGLTEVAGNCGRQHARFAREMDRAREAGFALVILIETGGPYRTLEDVAHWTSVACRRCEHRRFGRCDPASSMRCRRYRAKPLQGATLMRIMLSMERDRACRFEFCHPAHTARMICELLGVRYE